MAAYVIAEIDVKDTAAYDDYKKGVGATVAKFGGRFMVRGGPAKGYEGVAPAGRVVVVEFPDMAALEAWYGSTDYAPLLKKRLAASTGRLIAVEGV
jgi:uncharacterized protein (DUF1330 family)